MEYRTRRHRTILAWSVCRSQGKCGGTATWILGKAFFLCLPWQCGPVTQRRPPSYSIRTAAPEYTGLLSAQPEGIEVVLRAHAEAPASRLKPAKQGILQQTELTSSLTRRSSKGSMVRLPPLPPSCLAAVTAGCLALPHLVPSYHRGEYEQPKTFMRNKNIGQALLLQGPACFVPKPASLDPTKT